MAASTITVSMSARVLLLDDIEQEMVIGVFGNWQLWDKHHIKYDWLRIGPREDQDHQLNRSVGAL